MSAKKKSRIIYLVTMACLLPFANLSANTQTPVTYSLAQDCLAKQLGWVVCTSNNCGGYYLEQPFVYHVNVEKNSSVEITSNHGLIAQRGTSTLEGSVTITRAGQQITANKVYLYRDPKTFKLIAAELVGNTTAFKSLVYFRAEKSPRSSIAVS